MESLVLKMFCVPLNTWGIEIGCMNRKWKNSFNLWLTSCNRSWHDGNLTPFHKGVDLPSSNLLLLASQTTALRVLKLQNTFAIKLTESLEVSNWVIIQVKGKFIQKNGIHYVFLNQRKALALERQMKWIRLFLGNKHRGLSANHKGWLHPLLHPITATRTTFSRFNLRLVLLGFGRVS